MIILWMQETSTWAESLSRRNFSGLTMTHSHRSSLTFFQDDSWVFGKRGGPGCLSWLAKKEASPPPLATTLAESCCPPWRGWLSLPKTERHPLLKLQGWRSGRQLLQMPQLGPSPVDAQSHMLAAPCESPLCAATLSWREHGFHFSRVCSPLTLSPWGWGQVWVKTLLLSALPLLPPLSQWWATDCVWLTLPLFPGGPTCLLASHLTLPSRTSPDLTISSTEDSSAPAETPCSMTGDWHPTWRKHLDAGMRNRCPDRPRAGMVSVGGEWLRLLLTGHEGWGEEEGREAAAEKEQGRSPADAREKKKTSSSFAHISFNLARASSSILTSPPPTPILFWLLIFTKEECLRLGEGRGCSLVWLSYMPCSRDRPTVQVMLSFPFTRVGLEMGTSFLTIGEGVCLRKTGCCEKGRRDNSKKPWWK